MAKAKQTFRCTECGWVSPKWVGQCRECREWGTIDEVAPAGTGTAKLAVITPTKAAQPIAQVDIEQARAIPTGIGEVDRVLGGGIVPGAVVLLAGEPGVGKSTLLLEVAAAMANSSNSRKPVLYITGEESASQVRLRAERVGAMSEQLLLTAQSDLGAVLGHIEDADPALLILDSVQTITSSTVEGGPGGTAQVRAVAAGVIAAAKQRNMPVLLVGHVTKDGGIAGPRILEHLVDVVCQFEGDRHARLRLLRAVKNRYGATDEVGCFELGERGMIELPDPSGLFLSNTATNVPGTCVTVTLEGRRPMPTEIQALVAASGAGTPRRTTAGVDHSRMAMTLAVLQARLGVDVSSADVYVSTVGGAKTAEPAIDLALALAVVSAAKDQAVLPSLIAIGEVGLTGDVRQCVGVQRRLSEAARLGFTTALVPAAGAAELRVPDGVAVMPVSNLAMAVSFALPATA